MQAYQLRINISKQEDGLWRAEAPGLPGCFADAETLHEALQDVQEVAALMLDLDRETGNVTGIEVRDGFEAVIPVVIEEHAIRRVAKRKKIAS